MKRPWLENYDKFVPQTLPYSKLNIPQMLARTVDKYPNFVALKYFGQEITYQQVEDASDNLARWLVFRGVKSGDSVGIIFTNTPQFVISFFAILKAGGVVVAMNPMYQRPELYRIIQECDVRCVLLTDEKTEDIKQIAVELPIHTMIVSEKTDLEQGDFEGGLGMVTIKDTQIKNMSKILAFGSCLHKIITNIDLDFSYSNDEPAIYQYSGGTTGSPKAAVGLHRNIVANTLQFMTWCDLQPMEEVILAAIPLYHVYGMVLAMMLGIRLAARIVLVPDARDIEYLLRTVAEEKVTFLPGVPNLYAAIIQHPSILEGKYDLESIKACISGSAPLHPSIKKKFEELTKGKLVEGYGLSEAPTATHCNPLFGDNRAGSFGLPLPDVDCKIVDVEKGNKDVGVGEPGELLIRGPQIMSGYKNNRKESAIALKGGWLHTGDIVRMDQDGYFYFIERKKDLIKVGGFQVWPNEVESVLLSMHGVRNAVVAGVPDDMGNERVVAWLEVEEKIGINQAIARGYCRNKLAAYKIPKEVYVVSSIPRSGVGKILRRELVRQYKEERS